MRIRKAKLSDKEFVKDLDKENMKEIIESTWQKHHGMMFDNFNVERCLILEIDSKPQGFAYFRIKNKKLNIWSFQINQSFQREGFGTRLMDHIIKMSREQGLKKIVLEAHKENEKAISFYKKLNFNLIKEVKGKIFFELELR